jgi:hypothetical protein
MTAIRPPQEDVVPVQGPDTTEDVIHHDKETDLTSNDAEGEVDPEIIIVVGNGHVAQSGKTKGATDGLNTEGTNMDKPLFIPDSNPPLEDDSPLWGSNPKVGKSNRSGSHFSSPASSSLSEPDNPQPSPPAPKNPPLGNVVTLGQKQPITRSLTGDATQKHRPRLDSPSLASLDSDDSSSESEEEESQGGKSVLTHPPPVPTFGQIRQPCDQTPADSDEEDTDRPDSPRPSPKTAVVKTSNPTPATTPLVPAPTSSNTVTVLTPGVVSSSLNAGTPNDRPAGTGTTLGGGGPDLTARTNSTGPTAPTGGMTHTGPYRVPNSPPLNSPTTNSGETSDSGDTGHRHNLPQGGRA